MDAGCPRMSRVRPAWVYPTPEMRKVAAESGVPLEIIAALRTKELKKVAKAYKAANITDYAKIALMKHEVTLVGKLVGFDTRDAGDKIYITLVFPTVKVVWAVDRAEWEKRDEDEWLNDFREWWYVKAKKVVIERGRGGKGGRREIWVAEKAKPIRVEEDMDAWKHLLEAYKRVYPQTYRIFALIALLGYAPSKLESHPAVWLPLIRGIAAFAPEPIHVLELTVPGTGKTSVAIKLMYSARWAYYNEPPSPASLVGDARTGRAIVAAHDGIWFDEIDKWPARSSKRETIAEIVEILLTGMEQGVWRRSKGGEKQIRVERRIPIYFSGNIGDARHPREWLITTFGKAIGDGGAKALEDRISIAVTAARREYADVLQGAVHRLVTRAGVLRAALRELRERFYQFYNDDVTGGFKGRKGKSVAKVAAALAALVDGADASSMVDLAKKLVAGVEDPAILMNEF